MTPDFAIGMGSNSGDRGGSLRGAAVFLAASPGVSGLRLSGVYETEPWGGVEGGPFLNCVAAGSFFGAPLDLLSICREAERRAGSTIEKHGSARILDLDILCVEGIVSCDPILCLPHPRLGVRRFVLIPLGEVWPGEIPGLGFTPSRLLLACSDDGEVRPVVPQPPPGALWEGIF
jgi:2-amino-4-hydroxy-6-hydroxymethyldihydropteridine diphosphokinase